MRRTIYILLFIFTSLSCSHINTHIKTKSKPEYKETDPELAPYVNDYKDLAKERGFVFTHPMNTGFKVIGAGNVIGLCTLSEKFHEVDIDANFWQEAGELQRKMLVWHELTHCLCNRDHDYEDGKSYPNQLAKLFDDLTAKIPLMDKAPPGYYADGCPLSIMAPIIASSACIDRHEEEYTQEMFNRCDPY